MAKVPVRTGEHPHCARVGDRVRIGARRNVYLVVDLHHETQAVTIAREDDARHVERFIPTDRLVLVWRPWR